MFRRRRPTREIAFSFDSFLDVVANVVGIILRLILVAWVGARSYKAFVPPPPAAESLPEIAAFPEPNDPLSPELERQRQETARLQALLLEQLKQFESQSQEHDRTARELAGLAARRSGLETEKAALESGVKAKGHGVETAALSLEQLRERGRKLSEEIEALRRAPSSTKTLRYHTPISKPVQSEEWMFECRRGRVTLIDIGTLLEHVQKTMSDRGESLRTQWEIRDVTAAVGAFRLRYVIERERGPLDGMGGPPSSGGGFRIGLSEWEVESVSADRGETADAALAANSEFRRVADHIDPHQAVITMCVYPDSFPLFRRLRDYLYERDVVVAGRPMPDGQVITATRHGSVSRGQ